MRVGVVGYGHLGKYLVKFILENEKHDLELDFVWNRNSKKLNDVRKELVLLNIEDVTSRNVNLIVEVAHPSITEKYGELFLSVADFLVGSPTALANREVENCLRKACVTNNRRLFIPSGAFWGAQDIKKMADINTLKELKVTMKKHPSAFRLVGELKDANEEVLKTLSTSLTLYDGPVRGLCPLAPNNVNTMAAAAIAAHTLGFDRVIGCLVSDPSLLQWHVVEVEVSGQPTKTGSSFQVKTVRKNPANPGVVTGTATYGSFCNSLLQAMKQPTNAGVHMC